MDEVRVMSDTIRRCRVNEFRYMRVYMSPLAVRCSRESGEFSVATTE